MKQDIRKGVLFRFCYGLEFVLCPSGYEADERSSLGRVAERPQPTLRTKKDIGSENPETWAVSGFFRAIFQGGIQKISFPKNDLWGGLEV